jgi:hypothetical protein
MAKSGEPQIGSIHLSSHVRLGLYPEDWAGARDEYQGSEFGER